MKAMKKAGLHFAEPRPESHQIESQDNSFVFWSQCQKILKSNDLVIFFSTFGAKARNSSNRVSWLSFCRLLTPRPECPPIDSPGNHFLDIVLCVCCAVSPVRGIHFQKSVFCYLCACPCGGNPFSTWAWANPDIM